MCEIRRTDAAATPASAHFRTSPLQCSTSTCSDPFASACTSTQTLDPPTSSERSCASIKPADGEVKDPRAYFWTVRRITQRPFQAQDKLISDGVRGCESEPRVPFEVGIGRSSACSSTAIPRRMPTRGPGEWPCATRDLASRPTCEQPPRRRPRAQGSGRGPAASRGSRAEPCRFGVAFPSRFYRLRSSEVPRPKSKT